VTARSAFEAKAEAVGVAVADAKAVDGKIADVDDLPFSQSHEFKRNRRPSLAPEAREHPGNDLESA
jgi:hypothetical protein